MYYNTDCIACYFEDNKINDAFMNGHIANEYFWDNDKKDPKYKLEDKSHTVKVRINSKINLINGEREGKNIIDFKKGIEKMNAKTSTFMHMDKKFKYVTRYETK